MCQKTKEYKFSENKDLTSQFSIEKKHFNEEESSDEDSDDSDPGSNMNKMRQQAEALVKMVGIKDHSEEIENLKLIIENNYEEFKLFTEDQSTDEAIRKLEDSLIKFQSSAAITAEKLVKIDEILETLQKNIENNDEKQEKSLNFLSTHLETINSTLQKTLFDLDEKTTNFVFSTKKTITEFDLQINQALNECISMSSQRKRDHNDNSSEFQKVYTIADNIIKQQESFTKSLESIHRSINLILEFSKISISLQYQDEIDRESIALIGYKDSKPSRGRTTPNAMNKTSISLDKQCISCSGQVNMITSAFKLACLAYTPSLVTYHENIYPRMELLEMQKKIIEGVHEVPANSDCFDRVRFSKTPKPA